MNGLFYGSGTALVTPFRDGKVDFAALGALIDWQMISGTDALVVLGTTGEPSTLSDVEREQIIAFAVEHAAGRVPVIAGTGSNDTAKAIALAHGAEAEGADALLVVTPYYNKAGDDGLIRHFSEIANCVRIPIIVYNVPSRTGVNLKPEIVVELAKHPRIRGIKEASGNMRQIAELCRLAGDGLYLYAGDDADAFGVLALGGQGVISVAANVVPTAMHELAARFRAGEIAESRAMQLSLLPLIRALFCEVNPIPVKAALAEMGRIGEEMRLPLTPLRGEKRMQLLKTLHDYALL